MAVVFCTALFAGSAVWADDATTLREAQAALDKAMREGGTNTQLLSGYESWAAAMLLSARSTHTAT